MRTRAEIEEFFRKVDFNLQAASDGCADQALVERYKDRTKLIKGAFEGCIPKFAWKVTSETVVFNQDVFKEVIKNYALKLDLALELGHGILSLGDNGCGKTLFNCYILMKALARGRTVYYTTLPQLDYDIKRGFSDSDFAARLETFLNTSDFLFLDEMGKGRSKEQTNFLATQLERILKNRTDNQLPILAASNLDFDGLENTYGPSIGSMLQLLEVAYYAPGDYREIIAERNRQKMEYTG